MPEQVHPGSPSSASVPQATEDVATLAADIERLEAVVANMDEAPRDTAMALAQAVERFHQAGLRALIGALKQDAAAATALRQAATDPQVYAMLRRLEILKPSMLEQVEAALDAVRPSLQAHGGDVKLVRLSPPDRVSIQLLGACDGCGASKVTLSEGVEKSLRAHCDWLRHVDQVGGIAEAASKPGTAQPINFVSPFAAGQR